MTDYKKLYSELLTNERIGRRERLAMAVLARLDYVNMESAAKMETWIEGKSVAPVKLNGKRRGRKPKAKKAKAVKGAKTGAAQWGKAKPKRKYQKKSSYWSKKKKK